MPVAKKASIIAATRIQRSIDTVATAIEETTYAGITGDQIGLALHAAIRAILPGTQKPAHVAEDMKEAAKAFNRSIRRSAKRNTR